MTERGLMIEIYSDVVCPCAISGNGDWNERWIN